MPLALCLGHPQVQQCVLSLMTNAKVLEPLYQRNAGTATARLTHVMRVKPGPTGLCIIMTPELQRGGPNPCP